MYANVAVNLPVEETFHYKITAEFAGHLKLGHLVEVSFGRKLAQGVIIGFDRTSQYASVAKPIRSLIDAKPILTPEQIKLAEWLSETYIAPLADCIRLFIPPGLSKRGDVLLTPTIDTELIETNTDTQKRLISLLAKRGPLRGRQVAASLPRKDWRSAAAQLEERGLLMRQPILAPPSVKPKTSNVAELAMPLSAVETVIDTTYNPDDMIPQRRNAARRRAAILRILAEAGRPLIVGDIYRQVEKASITDLRVLADDDVIMLREREILRDPLGDKTFVPDTPPRLTIDQMAAWERIATIMDSDKKPPVLLHGVTGSGKTEIYLRAVEKALERDQTAIILVPEIALTPQTVRRFGRRFPGRLGLVHSSLSQGERYDTWRRAREGQFSIVIGPRSALFTPMPNLGLIVIDECHDDSYKQTPPIPPPYYHAVDAASTLAELSNATLVMGTATPNVTRYVWAQEGHYELLTLPARIMGHRRVIQEQAARHNITETGYTTTEDAPEEAVMMDLPPVEVVDMRHEIKVGNTSIFSRQLTTALEEVLPRGEQAILFLNRRGAATHVVCRDCGYVMISPRSDIPMTYHTYGPHQGKLVDHLTGYTEPHPDTCPECGSSRIKFFGGGTQRLEDEVAKRFPEARIVRWDADTTTSKGSHEELLHRFVTGEANVLVGTQMVAKGLDLPLVTLVGVISADTALYLPDYRAGERTFQLLTQVAGRAGRGILGGRVILQTYAPGHYAVQAAAEHDFDRFFAEERTKRADLDYPPFNRLVRIIVRGYDVERVEKEATRVHNQLREAITARSLTHTGLIGPAPCFYARIDDIHRWHVIVRGSYPTALVADVIEPAKYLQIDVDPVSLL